MRTLNCIIVACNIIVVMWHNIHQTDVKIDDKHRCCMQSPISGYTITYTLRKIVASHITCSSTEIMTVTLFAT